MNTMTFLGDVWLPKPVGSKVRLDGPYVFNLESPITQSSRPVQGKINLKTEGAFFVQTFGKDPVAVCLANNHIIDYGLQGFNDTLRILDKRGIKYFGAGTLQENCRNPLVLDCAGRRVALMGYVCPSAHPIFAQGNEPGVMPIDLGQIRKDIESARQQKCERIIVHLHWGEEQVYLPKPQDVDLGRQIIDLGADLIIGHHAHCIQPCEKYDGKHIFYGLGNAIFPNLRVPSFCDEQGRPSKLYIKTQKSWNKKSLMVEYSPLLGFVHVRHLTFNLHFLKETGKKKFPALNFNAGNYGQRYERAYQVSMFRDLVGSFLSQPKLPKLCHLQYMFSLFGKKTSA